MDDFAGTQAPVRRMTDPIEMVGELESAVPGLAELRLPKPSSISRQVVEADLGVALPADSRLLCELYPPFVLGDFLGVGGPDPGGEHSWVQGTRETLETIAEWCEEAEPAVPLHAHPAPGGLPPWADSNRGDFFLWTTNPARPQDWTVTVASRSSARWHYTGGAVQFLADLVSGAVEPWALPTIRPSVVAW
ncbi:SMI1/KNR4 family protein [Streptomyces viridifaciens]|nr:SMI1/KNR4 family protein [Streptomyces viridifaciens]UKZ09237.1 SMI1/KNR4 family protein [Streptomyces viridifaciens]